ncbi:glutamate racemase [Cyclonatronum proteinivorum]|uniref:Glutamate racemase n=1 Tax=Cyclonatronum proteinivorum TaxID=1457365 RepID=A0A345UMW1_9BACT|nr:glutamate racemase [Cyclonatronum proteinivorum]AXJ01813.1 glutamate racemase [Cyclonatronum proteinivorum]
MSSKANAPIGIFDSGIGGLTVVKAVMEKLPHENIIYYGDTARVPYGIKSISTVREYALQITDFLLTQQVKTILIACNTVSAAANQDVRARAGTIPVLDVVEAGTKAALRAQAASNRIGVIGTMATINSQTYEQSILKENSNKRVYSKACPMLVPLAEEGWISNEISRLTIAEYLQDFRDKSLDALILGCTHYPLFKTEIEDFLKDSGTDVIDSAVSIAAKTEALLTENELLNTSGKTGRFDCFVSDKPQRFQTLAERFLGKKLNRIEISPLL